MRDFAFESLSRTRKKKPWKKFCTASVWSRWLLLCIRSGMSGLLYEAYWQPTLLLFKQSQQTKKIWFYYTKEKLNPLINRLWWVIFPKNEFFIKKKNRCQNTFSQDKLTIHLYLLCFNLWSMHFIDLLTIVSLYRKCLVCWYKSSSHNC